MILTISRIFFTLRVLLCEKLTYKILLVLVKLMDFKTPLREHITVISLLLKFSFSPEKRKNSLKVFIRVLTDFKPSRKIVESSVKAVYEKI